MSRLPSWVYDHPEVWTSPYRQGGDPCIRGTRTNASIILDYIKTGATDSEILEDFPGIRPNQIEALRTATEHHTKENSMSNRMSVERARRLTDGGVHTIHGGLVIPAARTIVDQDDRIAWLEDELHHVTQHALAQSKKLGAQATKIRRLQEALRNADRLGPDVLANLIEREYITEKDLQ